METKDVRYFTPRQEELVAMLSDLGLKKNTAKVLVYLTHVRDATSWDIEKNADLRQSEVSHALAYLSERGWIGSRAGKTGSHGRPVKIFALTTTFSRIIDAIETEKTAGMTGMLDRIRNLREYTSRTETVP